MLPQEKTGKLFISTKLAKIFTVEGNYEELKYKLTSGISGQHSKGGQSAPRFYRKREELVEAFFKRIRTYQDSLDISIWNYEGDKEIIKRFKRG